MKRKSASTLIYFHDKVSKKKLVKRHPHINREKRSRHVKLTVKVLTAFLLVVGITWSYNRYKPLDISKLEITGAERFVNKADVNKIAREKALGRNIIFFDQKNLEEIIASNFLATKTVRVERIFPNTLEIKVTERIPIALILPKDAKTYYFVDSDGLVLGEADKTNTNLPTINYNQDVEVGKFSGVYLKKRNTQGGDFPKL